MGAHCIDEVLPTIEMKEQKTTWRRSKICALCRGDAYLQQIMNLHDPIQRSTFSVHTWDL